MTDPVTLVTDPVLAIVGEPAPEATVVARGAVTTGVAAGIATGATAAVELAVVGHLQAIAMAESVTTTTRVPTLVTTKLSRSPRQLKLRKLLHRPRKETKSQSQQRYAKS